MDVSVPVCVVCICVLVCMSVCMSVRVCICVCMSVEGIFSAGGGQNMLVYSVLGGHDL